MFVFIMSYEKTLAFYYRSGDADRFFHTRLHVERRAWLYEGDDICGYEALVFVA